MRDLTHGSIPRHITMLATPIAVSMLVQTLYYLVDLYFISRLGGTALAGASAAGNVFFLVLATTQMLSVGTVAVVAHAVGNSDRDRANLAFNQSVLIAAILATSVLIAGYLGLGDLYIERIGADAETVAAGKTYLVWLIPGLSIQFAIVAMGGALQGTGIVKPTMVVQILSVLANIVLTPILIAGWLTGRPMGVAGAALASTLATALGVLLMTIYFVRLERYVRLDPARLRPRPEIIRRILAIGAPAGGEFALMFVYLMVIYAVIRVFGAEAQAGFGLGMRVMQAVFLPALAIAFATPAIAGQNYGARNGARVRETFRTAALMNVGFMLGLTLLCQWNPRLLVQGFSNEEAVLVVATGFLATISWNFVAAGLNFTCSGIFQGVGNTIPSLAATATRLVTFVVPVFWLARRPDFEIVHVWYLSVATVTFQVLVSLWLLRRELRRRLAFDTGPASSVGVPEVPESP